MRVGALALLFASASFSGPPRDGPEKILERTLRLEAELQKEIHLWGDVETPTLQACDEGCIPVLADLLANHRLLMVRYRALWALWQRFPEEVGTVRACLVALDDEDPLVVGDAIACIARAGERARSGLLPEILDRLSRLAMGTGSCTAVRTLVDLEGERALPVLVRLRDRVEETDGYRELGDAHWQAQCVDIALAQLGDDPANGRLVGALSRAEGLARLGALNALAQVGRRQNAGVLVPFLSERKPSVRECVVHPPPAQLAAYGLDLIAGRKIGKDATAFTTEDIDAVAADWQDLVTRVGSETE